MNSESSAKPVATLREWPELPIGLFAFLLHFVWEFLQAPFWVGMAELPHWEGVRTCTVATLGDVLIALVAFWIGALAARSRAWLLIPELAPTAIYMIVGLALTIIYEFLATGPLARWEYADSMPRLPGLGTGLVPVLQWLTLPVATLWLARRYAWGGLVLSRNAAR